MAVSRPSDELIFDRTKSDVEKVKKLAQKWIDETITAGEVEEWNAGLKGAMNAADLNRIEAWLKYAEAELRARGYYCGMRFRSSAWTMTDILYRSDLDRIRSNVNTLRNCIYAIPDWREIEISNTMSWQQMNATEWDIQTIFTWLEKVMAFLFYSGEIYSGEVTA